ncbi:MAG: hypothetical protein KGJ60_03960 [Verrucomicrobiota bacterium]|nr:hypothetical protein [Verrucomicrobiota bacterium]
MKTNLASPFRVLRALSLLAAAAAAVAPTAVARQVALRDANIPPYGLNKPGRILLARPVVLQDSRLRVAFDRRSGALTRLEDKTTHWLIERRPDLGVSFRLFAPLPHRNYNPVFGLNQHAAEVKKLSDHDIRLRWKNLVSKNGGVLPMTLTSAVTLTNGELTFNATLENDSPLTVDTIDYPYLGDLNPPTRHAPLDMRVMRDGHPDNLWTTEVYPHFSNEHGYWGDFFPLKTREAQQSRFCLIQSPDEGLYVEMDAPQAPYRMQYTFELRPGVISSVNNRVPEEDDISGIPVHLEFRTCHFIFLKPHSTVKLAPIVVRCYRGDGRAGVEIYKQWRSTPAR